VIHEGNFNLDLLEFEPVGSAPRIPLLPAIGAIDQVQKIRRSLNILGEDPLGREQAKARFKDRLFHRIHLGGLQTVRVHLHASNELSVS
jgi:hypothetical protein